jgi:hypothetical protein
MHFPDLIAAATSLFFGLLVGVSFGAMQANARRRHERRQQQNGNLNNGWTNVPGSMQRVAFLLGMLGLAQIFLPLVFMGANKWCVSAGVAAGYGWILYTHLRQRRLAV